MKQLFIKFNGGQEDLETILEYIGLSADTYNRVVLNAQQFIEAKYPCLITISDDTQKGFTLRFDDIAVHNNSGKYLDAEEILSDLRRDRRKASVQDLMKKCERYMGYCELCPYNKACEKILATYRECK
jgi:hypothetical protein